VIRFLVECTHARLVGAVAQNAIGELVVGRGYVFCLDCGARRPVADEHAWTWPKLITSVVVDVLEPYRDE
jgi:hypothetical protein